MFACYYVRMHLIVPIIVPLATFYAYIYFLGIIFWLVSIFLSKTPYHHRQVRQTKANVNERRQEENYMNFTPSENKPGQPDEDFNGAMNILKSCKFGIFSRFRRFESTLVQMCKGGKIYVLLFFTFISRTFQQFFVNITKVLTLPGIIEKQN